MSTFRPLATRLRIEPGTLGAALSRLTADGWLTREKRGRHSLYRPDAPSQAVFADASRRIYEPDAESAWDGRWLLVMLPPQAPPPNGFVRLDERTWGRLRLDGDADRSPSVAPFDPMPSGAVVFEATVRGSEGLGALARQAWDLDTVATAYGRWRERFAPLRQALAEGERLDPLSAMCARLLLIHDFRRVVLKDPELPETLRGADWPGRPARREAAALYRALLTDSEAWLDASDATPVGPLPTPASWFYERFGGLR